MVSFFHVEAVSEANALRARVFSGDATVANLTGGGTFTAGTPKKADLAWQANDFRLVIDGSEAAALHGTTFFLGQHSDNSRKLFGHIED